MSEAALASLAEPPTHAVQITKRRLHEMTGVSLEYVGTCLRHLASRTPPVLGIVPQQAPESHSPAANLYYFPGIVTPASITAQQQHQRATQGRQLSTLERRRAERQLREMLPDCPPVRGSVGREFPRTHGDVSAGIPRMFPLGQRSEEAQASRKVHRAETQRSP